MLVEICGEYFNPDDLRHMYAASEESVVIELMNGDMYHLQYFKGDSMNVEEYLRETVRNINMVSGRIR